MSQAPAHVPPGRGGTAVPAALHARHARPDRGVRRGAAPDAHASVLHGDARELDLGGPSTRRHVAAVPGADRLPRPAPLRLRAARASTSAASRSSAGPRAAPAARRSRRTSTASPTCSRNAAARLAPGAPVCIVVNDRRDLYPEILDRAGLRLVDRLERHVNRRTGRRGGEYFESVLVCRPPEPDGAWSSAPSVAVTRRLRSRRSDMENTDPAPAVARDGRRVYRAARRPERHGPRRGAALRRTRVGTGAAERKAPSRRRSSQNARRPAPSWRGTRSLAPTVELSPPGRLRRDPAGRRADGRQADGCRGRRPGSIGADHRPPASPCRARRQPLTTACTTPRP